MRTREEQIEEMVQVNSAHLCHEDYTPDNLRMMLAAAISEAEERARAEVDLGTVSAMARGYEEMFKVLSHIVGTSGASVEWYRARAQEALSWVSPTYALSSAANVAPCGSCQWISQEGNLEKMLKPYSAKDATMEDGK